MRVAFGLVAAVLVYCSCYCLLLKGGSCVEWEKNGSISRDKPVYRFVGPGGPYLLFGRSVGAFVSLWVFSKSELSAWTTRRWDRDVDEQFCPRLHQLPQLLIHRGQELLRRLRIAPLNLR